MFPTMQSANKLNGILFCVMIFGMLIYSLPIVYMFSINQTKVFSLFVKGELLRRAERFYDKNLFFHDPSVKMWASLRFLLFDEGTSGVIIGNEGWLFTNQEYLVPVDLQTGVEEAIKKIVVIQNRLKQNGKRLVVLPIPLKADIYAEYAKNSPDQRAIVLYDNFTRKLQENGVDVTVLRASFMAEHKNRPLFVSNDTHWSPAGAQLAAQELKKQYPQLLGNIEYQTVLAGEKDHRGDLLNYLQFYPVLAPDLFKNIRVPLYETFQPDQSVSEETLFGEQKVPLILVGTSYSKTDFWNFSGFLREALQSDLVNFSLEAYGPFQSMEALFCSDFIENPDIHTVIWEFPLRTLLVEQMRVNAPKTPDQHL